MRYILILVAILIITTSLFSQYYEPLSPLVFDRTSIEKNAISRKIAATRKLYTPIDIEELKIQIKKNNNAVDNQIALIKNQMTGVFMDKQELLKLVDIKKMEEQIALKEKSRSEIKAQIQQDLANIVYYGLYLVVLNDIDPFASKEQLSSQAEKLLAPIAIEDLNGVFVSSLTVVQDNKLLFDQIKATISGEMGIEKQYISRIIANRTKFLYLVKVNVAPLKKALAATTPYLPTGSNHVTVNFLTEYDFQARLKLAGIPEAEIKEIEAEVSSAREVVNSSNAMSTRRQQQIMAQGNANLKKVDDEIAELKNSLANRSRLLKETIEGKTDVIYNSQDIAGCINRALSYFDRKIKELQDQMIAAKEKELILKEMVNVTAEGKPEEDIAKTAVDVCGQIKQSYSKVEQFIHETEVVNYMLASDKTGSAKDIFREVDKIWLYPVPGSSDNFLLTVVARFKISALKDHQPAAAGDRSVTAPSLPSSTPPATIVVNGIELVFIKGGTFDMGDTFNEGEGDEQPVHSVTVSDFYLGKTEVTQQQWVEIMGSNPSSFKGDNLPVETVSWNDVQEFIRKLNARTGGNFRLPTEAEWEYAAREGGKRVRFGNGKNIADPREINFDPSEKYSYSVAGVYRRQTTPVASFAPNALGLYDMSGNVWEWCADWYDENYYSKSPPNNPTGPATGADRVIRGGSWSSYARYVRCADRDYYAPDHRYDYLGFRLCRAAQ
ncbi:MAG: SUMF1/EgtB/PvdO family nonheme iron enzyme [candidate division KSB1 bacterium]|nr:SUMF1/EgtB/PvdO family nonheme iron enzyme [candidate division KSB1 bacterium]